MNRHSLQITIVGGILAALAACGEDPVQPAGSPAGAVRSNAVDVPAAAITASPSASNTAPVPVISIQEFWRVEGKPITFSAVGTTDAERDSIVYLWTFGDSATAVGRVVTHVYADQGDYAVSLRAVDEHGASATASAQLAILNATPHPGTLSVPALLQEGVPFVLADVGATDAERDMAAGLMYSFDCGTSNWTPFAKAPAAQCPGLPDNGPYQFRVRVMDKDSVMKMTGAAGNAVNMLPVVTFLRLEQYGAFLTAAVTFSDVRVDLAEIRFSWGDGLASLITGAVPGGLYPASHRYTESGTYTLYVRVTDKDGNRGGASAVIVVN